MAHIYQKGHIATVYLKDEKTGKQLLKSRTIF